MPVMWGTMEVMRVSSIHDCSCSRHTCIICCSAEVLAAFTALHPTQAVRGNVDEAAPLAVLPEHRLLQLNGWRVLLLHICGLPPKLDPAAEQLVRQQLPDVVVFGHSHKHGAAVVDRRLFVNPGAAGKQFVA